MSVNVGTVERGRLADLVRPSYLAWAGIGLGVVAFWLALPPVTARSPLVPLASAASVSRQASGRATSAPAAGSPGALSPSATLGIGLGWLATRSEVTSLEQAFVWSALIAATFRAATPLTFAALGGIFSERSGVVNIGLEGMLLMGAFFGFLGADKLGDWWWGILIGSRRRAGAGARARVHLHPPPRRPDRQRHGRQLPRARQSRATSSSRSTPTRARRGTSHRSRRSRSAWLGIPDDSFVDKAFGDWHLLIWVALAFVVISTSRSSVRPSAFVCARWASTRRPLTRSASPCTAIRYAAVILSGALAGMGGVYISNGITHAFSENMTAGRGFIALAAVIFGRWRPFGALAACLLFGFTEALALRLPGAYGSDAAWTTLFRGLPYVVTLVVVAGVVGRSIPPAAVGRPTSSNDRDGAAAGAKSTRHRIARRRPGRGRRRARSPSPPLASSTR